MMVVPQESGYGSSLPNHPSLPWTTHHLPVSTLVLTPMSFDGTNDYATADISNFEVKSGAIWEHKGGVRTSCGSLRGSTRPTLHKCNEDLTSSQPPHPDHAVIQTETLNEFQHQDDGYARPICPFVQEAVLGAVNCCGVRKAHFAFILAILLALM